MSKQKTKWTPPTDEHLAQPCTPTHEPVDIGNGAGAMSFEGGYCTTHHKIMSCGEHCAAKRCDCEAA